MLLRTTQVLFLLYSLNRVRRLVSDTVEDHPPKEGEVLQKNSHVVLVVLGSKSINNLLSFRQLQNAVMYDPEAIMRLLFTPKLTKEKCRQSYNLAQNVLRPITKITNFSSHPGKNENCR